MAKAEAKHGADLLTERAKLFGRATRRVDRSVLWDVEAPGYETVHDFMTLREALKVAMDAEVKAYDYFDRALKLPLAPAVKKLFEELREDEIAHQDMVKKELAKAPPDEAANPEDFADEPVAQ
jgi:ferritin-like protein